MYRILKVNNTEHWNSKFLAEHGIKCAKTVYVFDDQLAVRACEITPSFELWPIRYEFDQPVATDEERDDLEQDTAIYLGEEDIRYQHCRSISPSECEDIGDHESMEDAIEYATCNGY